MRVDGGMEERGQMSLEEGQQEWETRDRQKGQLIPRPEAEWTGMDSCWAGSSSSSEVAREVGGVGSKARALLRGLATWEQGCAMVSSRAPRPPPGVWLPAPCSGHGPRVCFEPVLLGTEMT